MNKQEAEALRATNERLEEENADLRRRLEKLEARGARADNTALDMERTRPTPKALADGRTDRKSTITNGLEITDELYDAIRTRMLKDPVVLKVATTKPVLDVEVRVNKITADGTGWVGRVAQLLAEGYFDDGPKKSGEVFKEVARRGGQGIPARADEAVKKLWQMGFLTREVDGFRAVPDMKVNIIES